MITGLVSIIMPTYNHDKFIKRSINSVLSQNYKNWELIIIDNYSTDLTENIINEIYDNRIVYLKLSNDGIIAKSRNYGIRFSKGEYLAFLDSDDFWFPNKLDISISYLNSGNDFVYHDLYITRTLNQFLFREKIMTRKLNRDNVFNDLLYNGNAVATSSVVMRKDLIINVNLFTEDIEIIGGEDYECWIKISKLTNKFYRLKGVFGLYSIMGQNTTSYKRNIDIANYISRKYLNFQNINRAQWLFYSKGYSFYKEKKFQEAYINLIKIRFLKIPIINYIKKYKMLVFIFLNKLSSSKINQF
jgi:glycosyltransferase involved in cell wall biosynthesis